MLSARVFNVPEESKLAVHADGLHSCKTCILFRRRCAKAPSSPLSGHGRFHWRSTRTKLACCLSDTDLFERHLHIEPLNTCRHVLSREHTGDIPFPIRPSLHHCNCPAVILQLRQIHTLFYLLTHHRIVRLPFRQSPLFRGSCSDLCHPSRLLYLLYHPSLHYPAVVVQKQSLQTWSGRGVWCRLPR